MAQDLKPAPLNRAERIEVGATRDGRALVLAPMTPDAAAVLGRACAAIGPWRHYAIGDALMTKQLAAQEAGAVRYQVLVAGEMAGAVIIRSPWLLGPYLQMLAVLPAFQNQAVGDALLRWYERAAVDAGHRQAWLCVTGVNVHAQRFYREHGWQQVGLIPDLVRDGDDELLMRKQFS